MALLSARSTSQQRLEVSGDSADAFGRHSATWRAARRFAPGVKQQQLDRVLRAILQSNVRSVPAVSHGYCDHFPQALAYRWRPPLRPPAGGDTPPCDRRVLREGLRGRLDA